MNQLRFAFKDIIRNLAAVILFMGMLAFAATFLTVYVNEVMLYQDVLTKVERVQECEIVDFDVIHPAELLIKPGMSDLLERTLDAEGNDYYVVIEQIGLSSQLSELGIPLYYGFGQFSEVYNLDPKRLQDSDAPFTVFIGSQIRNLAVGDVITLGDKFSKTIDVPVAGRLPHNASFLRSYGNFIEYLDNSILVLTSFSAWQSYHLTDTGALLQNIHFIGWQEKDILAFAHGIEEASTYKVRPKNFSEQIREKAVIFRDSAAQSFSIYSLVFVLVSAAAVSNLLMLMERNLREYAIHRLYGATLGDLYLRTLIYIAIIALPPFALGYWRLLRDPYFPVPPKSKLMILGLAILTIGIAAVYPMVKLKKQDINADLRRE